MQHEYSAQKSFEIEDSEKDFNYWLTRPYISKSLSKDLSEVDLLIIPFEGWKDINYPLFPVGTEKILDFFKKNNEKLEEYPKIKVDICIEEKDYKELSLNADLMILGGFIIKYTILPTAGHFLITYSRTFLKKLCKIITNKI